MKQNKAFILLYWYGEMTWHDVFHLEYVLDPQGYIYHTGFTWTCVTLGIEFNIETVVVVSPGILKGWGRASPASMMRETPG